jgi:diguanylate cyclase (GGDEF)-like protein
MEGAIVRTTLALIGPAILSVFGIAFLCSWMIERKRGYLLLLAGACALFAFGAGCQILYLPRDAGLNAMISGLFYTAAVLLAVEGTLLRSGRALGWAANAAILAGFMTLLWYFFYVDRNLLARVYVQNFGYGLLLLVAAIRLRALARGRYVDRALFWVLLAFAVQFFPRTLLTIGLSPPATAAAFGNSTFWQLLQLSLAVFGSALCLAILSAAAADVIADLRLERDVDPLTGVLNRRGIEERIASHFRPSGAGSGSLILCDIDHFKQINDAHGHDGGDAVLRKIGDLLQGEARKGDLVGRMGGEEFAVFLPDADLREAHECSERLRKAIATTMFAVSGAGERRVTASFGVATIEPGDGWARLYKRADMRLYEAKAAGRNRTVASSEAPLAAGADRRARMEAGPAPL